MTNAPNPKFIPVASDFFVAPQITAAEVAEAAAMGVRAIVNNRPDHEEPGQPTSDEIAAAAKAAGVAYLHAPVGQAGISEAQLADFNDLAAADAPILAFCRSGMRSIVLRSMAKVYAGADVDSVLAEADAAGFQLHGHRPLLDAVAS